MQFYFRLVAIAICSWLPMFSQASGDENATLDKAVQWLVKQQDESGAWKSKHYGAMKQGAALTSLALYSLSMTPDSIRKSHSKSIERAFLFLEPGTMARGRVANPDGSLDHPVYSTAMFLIATHRFDRKLDAKQAAVLLEFLVRSQCVEERGFSPDNPNYGGWDVIGPDVMAGKTAGTNVSVTRFVLEAFSCYAPIDAEPKTELDDEIVSKVKTSRLRAVDWLTRLQGMNADGGFRFSAQPGSALNKSKTTDGTPRSYGSATCDGLLSMHFGGIIKGDVYDSVWAWQKTKAQASKVAGFAKDQKSSWPRALQFYHLQSLARSTSFCTDPRWAEKMKSELASVIGLAQRDDGRFQNDTALMREDDPLIATSFAILALSAE